MAIKVATRTGVVKQDSPVLEASLAGHAAATSAMTGKEAQVYGIIHNQYGESIGMSRQEFAERYIITQSIQQAGLNSGTYSLSDVSEAMKEGIEGDPSKLKEIVRNTTGKEKKALISEFLRGFPTVSKSEQKQLWGVPTGNINTASPSSGGFDLLGGLTSIGSTIGQITVAPAIIAGSAISGAAGGIIGGAQRGYEEGAEQGGDIGAWTGSGAGQVSGGLFGIMGGLLGGAWFGFPAGLKEGGTQGERTGAYYGSGAGQIAGALSGLLSGLAGGLYTGAGAGYEQGAAGGSGIDFNKLLTYGGLGLLAIVALWLFMKQK